MQQSENVQRAGELIEKALSLGGKKIDPHTISTEDLSDHMGNLKDAVSYLKEAHELLRGYADAQKTVQDMIQQWEILIGSGNDILKTRRSHGL